MIKISLSSLEYVLKVTPADQNILLVYLHSELVSTLWRHFSIENFFSSFGDILDFTTDDTEAYGIIRAYLEKAGKVIGLYDMQIAAQGLARNLTIIINNYDEFTRIPGLKVEDWTKE